MLNNPKEAAQLSSSAEASDPRSRYGVSGGPRPLLGVQEPGRPRRSFCAIGWSGEVTPSPRRAERRADAFTRPCVEGCRWSRTPRTHLGIRFGSLPGCEDNGAAWSRILVGRRPPIPSRDGRLMESPPLRSRNLAYPFGSRQAIVWEPVEAAMRSMRSGGTAAWHKPSQPDVRPQRSRARTRICIDRLWRLPPHRFPSARSIESVFFLLST